LAWETRFGRRYYYRGRRVNGRVHKQYLGRGPEAEAAAKEDAERHTRIRAERDAHRAEQQACKDVLENVEAFDRQVRGVVKATLVAMGFHQHARGQWRRRRRSE
jgi:hypothetical protein